MIEKIKVKDEYKEKVIHINRVSKVVKGGKRFKFSALVVVGDEIGHVGVGLGKAGEVSQAITKGRELGKKNLMKVSMKGSTVPYPTIGRFCDGAVLLKPAAPGTGIIAGKSVKAVLELAGISDVLTKSLKSNNPINVVYATLDGLQQIKRLVSVVNLRKGIETSVLEQKGGETT